MLVIAFAGHGSMQTAVRFCQRKRENLIIKVESVGPGRADIKNLAEGIDKQMIGHFARRAIDHDAGDLIDTCGE